MAELRDEKIKFEENLDVKPLLAHLRKWAVEDPEKVRTYEELGRVVGVPHIKIDNHYAYALEKAMRLHECEGTWWTLVRGVGIRVGTEEEKIEVAKNKRRRFAKAAKKVQERAESADPEQLSEKAQTEQNTLISQFRVVVGLSNYTFTRKLRKVVTDVQQRLPDSTVLRLFMKEDK
jgi:hypothetical protein